MKWQTAPPYLRRSTARIDASAVLGPVIDLLAYLAAVGAGTTTLERDTERVELLP